MLEEGGIDAVELSGGTPYSGKYNHVRKSKQGSAEEEAFYTEAAQAYREAVDVPVMLVGGIRSYETADRLVGSGLVDYISLSRPLIREPHLINRWKSGDTRKASCLSDNLCFEPARRGDGICCVVEDRMLARS